MLARLGPRAEEALPVVEHLFALRPSPITNSSSDADSWRVAMVRMGKPVEAVPFPDLPDHLIAKCRENVARNAARAAREEN